jgi:hypothetical protein
MKEHRRKSDRWALRALAVASGLMALVGCRSEFKSTVTPFPDACPEQCHPCDGVGPVVTYSAPAGAPDCARFDPEEFKRDHLCLERYPSGVDTGWPHCFYDCGDDPRDCKPPDEDCDPKP